MRLESVRKLRWVTAGCVALLLSLAACGSDSTGPSTNLDAVAALKSLSLITSTDGTSGIRVPALVVSFAPQLRQMNVTINGRSQTMFALGLRETYPDGTCEETLFVDPLNPDPPGQCTPLSATFTLILWQSHSADAPPDRLAAAIGDVGLMNFEDLATGSGALPGLAFYTEGQNDIWVSVSGTLTSNVSATGQSCAVALPPYAKSGSCNVAAFDESGTINFEPVTGSSNVILEIPRQTINGIWQDITETQTVILP